LDAAGHCADRIIEAATQPALASVGPPTEKSTLLLLGIEDLSSQVAAITAEEDRLRANFRNPPQLQRQNHQPQGYLPRLQEPPLGQQIPKPK
jgi:uncharacterized small protein (DUF1192 family)